MDRREFIARSAALTAAASLPSISLAEEKMATRLIPGTDEELPVIGLGAPTVFIELPPEGKSAPKALIHELMRHGGTVIDTPAFNRGKDPILGPLLSEMGIQDDLFLIGKITTSGKQEGIDHLEWTERLLNKRPIDALLVHNIETSRPIGQHSKTGRKPVASAISVSAVREQLILTRSRSS